MIVYEQAESGIFIGLLEEAPTALDLRPFDPLLLLTPLLKRFDYVYPCLSVCVD